MNYLMTVRYFYAVHTDTDNLHIHFVFSSVKKDGRKWNFSGGKFREFKNKAESLADKLFSDSAKYKSVALSSSRSRKSGKNFWQIKPKYRTEDMERRSVITELKRKYIEKGCCSNVLIF